MAIDIELIDLVDSSGNVRVRGIPRHEADGYSDLHMQIIIGIVINDKGQILVHKRSHTKKVNPGDIDHVCGGVISGETPVEAFIRESLEETGVKPNNIFVATHGVNKYNRYRYLMVGESNDTPGQLDSNEVEWAQFIHPDELKLRQQSGELSFVNEFFEDTALAIMSKYSINQDTN